MPMAKTGFRVFLSERDMTLVKVFKLMLCSYYPDCIEMKPSTRDGKNCNLNKALCAMLDKIGVKYEKISKQEIR